jgi:tetratricopeptide (TPR) repeat protein
MRRLGLVLLIGALVGASLLNGGVELWVLLPCSMVMAASVALTLWSTPASEPRLEASVLFFCAVALTLYTAFQALPLPASFIRDLSPHAADIWARALHPIHRGGPRWHPVTLDPHATRVEVLRGAMYLSTFVAAWSLAREHEARRRLEQALTLLPVAVAFGTALHLGLDAHKLWGVYAPRTGVGIVAPFFNKNHLSGFINIGLIFALASTLSRHPLMPRVVLATIVVGLSGMVVFLGSRGALGSAIVGIGLVLLLSLLLARRSGRRPRWNVVSPIVIAVAGAGMIVLGRYGSSARALQRTDVSALALARACLTEVVRAYPLVGMGRGSFESGYPEFRHDMGWFVYTHPENIVAQWVCEWGLPAGIVGLCACFFALRPRIAMARSRAAVGPLVALVALFIQNLVDFSSESPGVVACLAVCAAIIVGGSAARGSARSRSALARRWAAHPRFLGGLLVTATILSGVWACTGAGHDLLADREELRVHSTGRDDDEDLIDAILRHPAEPYFSYVGAIRASRHAPERVPAWVGHTLERAPVYGPAHVVLARWLRSRAPAQARLEYRLAQEQGGVSIPEQEYAALINTYFDALEIAPSGRSGIVVLGELANGMALREPSSAVRINAEILRRDPANFDALVRQAEAAWFDVVDDAPWCPACKAEALSTATQLERYYPRKCEGHLLRARVLAVEGTVTQAVSDLKDAAESMDDRSYCTSQLATLAIAVGDDAAASDAIRKLADAPCVHASSCSDDLLAAARLELLRHSPNRALIYLRRAARSSPERDDVQMELGDVASQVGFYAEALRAYRTVSERNPTNVWYRDVASRAASAAARSNGAQR